MLGFHLCKRFRFDELHCAGKTNEGVSEREGSFREQMHGGVFSSIFLNSIPMARERKISTKINKIVSVLPKTSNLITLETHITEGNRGIIL